MAFFQYTGDADAGTLATSVFGLVFPKGFSVEVTDALAVEKLRAHPRFTEVKIDEADEPVSEAIVPKRGRPRIVRDVIEPNDDGA